MEEPELRVGGWEKKSRGRWLKRLLSIFLILIVVTLSFGHLLVDYSNKSISDRSIYLSLGHWNGPFNQDYSKDFNGLMKSSSVVYETSDSQSGILVIKTINSLIDLEEVGITNIVVAQVEDEAQNQELTLINNGVVLNDYREGLPPSASAYQWIATGSSGFFSNNDGQIIVKAVFWTVPLTQMELLNYQTIICIAFGINSNTIEQASELMENVI